MYSFLSPTKTDTKKIHQTITKPRARLNEAIYYYYGIPGIQHNLDEAVRLFVRKCNNKKYYHMNLMQIILMYTDHQFYYKVKEIDSIKSANTLTYNRTYPQFKRYCEGSLHERTDFINYTFFSRCLSNFINDYQAEQTDPINQIVYAMLLGYGIFFVQDKTIAIAILKQKSLINDVSCTEIKGKDMKNDFTPFEHFEPFVEPSLIEPPLVDPLIGHIMADIYYHVCCNVPEALRILNDIRSHHTYDYGIYKSDQLFVEIIADNNFKPNQNITQQDITCAIQILNRSIKKIPNMMMFLECSHASVPDDARSLKLTSVCLNNLYNYCRYNYVNFWMNRLDYDVSGDLVIQRSDVFESNCNECEYRDMDISIESFSLPQKRYDMENISDPCILDTIDSRSVRSIGSTRATKSTCSSISTETLDIDPNKNNPLSSNALQKIRDTTINGFLLLCHAKYNEAKLYLSHLHGLGHMGTMKNADIAMGFLNHIDTEPKIICNMDSVNKLKGDIMFEHKRHEEAMKFYNLVETKNLDPDDMGELMTNKTEIEIFYQNCMTQKTNIFMTTDKRSVEYMNKKISMLQEFANASAYRLIGKIYSSFFLNNYGQAKKNYEKAKIMGSVDAIYELAHLELGRGETITGIQLMKEAANRGHMMAKTFVNINTI